jgi:regulator of protease activity HflC (stomatin/prohibitin superfamily)
MTNYVSPLLFMALLIPGGLLAARIGMTNLPAGIVLMVVWAIADAVVASAIRLAAEWERAVVFRLGKFLQVKGPPPDAANH